MKPVAHTRLAIVPVLLLSLVVTSFSLASVAASPTIRPAAQDAVTHIVQPGDTLYSLARRYGTTVSAIMEANGLSNPNFIWVGQRLTIPQGMTPSPGPGCDVIHVVQRGETLYAIAPRYGTTVAAIVQANGLSSPNFIWVGQRLTIPVCGTPTLVTSTPTASPTATKPVPTASPTPTGATPTASPSTTAVSPTPTVTPSPTSGCEMTYAVQWGDTLSSIARRFGTTVATIVAANHLPNPDFIWVGQRLVIPVCGTPIPTFTPVPSGDRWIDVNLSTQTLIAFQGSTPVLQTLISSGTAQYPSPVGTYYVYLKLISQDMYGPGYYLPDVPYVMYFYGGYALHGTYWHNNFGQPMSHGCINLPIPEAGWLYEWTPMGTPVVLHY